MSKKLIALSFFLLNILTFAKVNDELGVLNDEQKVSIEKKIEEISEKRGINIYVNTFSGDEGFVADKAEKLVILNLTKPEEKSLKVELKLTKDMELEEVQEDIDNILNGNEKSLKEKNYSEYITEVLVGIDGVLENIKFEEPIVVEEEVVQEKKNGFFIGMGIAFFVIFGIIIRVLMIKYRKSFKEEMEIVSRRKY
ncbi:hypothetical protein [Fusobacterium sp.]|uniref:hypothetical protein n=1 Tax=Fusobacterium sp. TaxID=68766 RepID=UPI0025BDA5F4|nr:hypothetical protein [Fusobacterium sp.]